MITRIRLKAFIAVCITLLCQSSYAGIVDYVTISKDVLLDKIKGGWAGQTIGCAYGGPTEFCYRGIMIPDSRVIEYPDGHLKYFYDHVPTLYDDIYMDLTFVEVFSREGINCPVSKFAEAFSTANYALWHANQLARYNILRGISPSRAGYWKNNPHADCIDYQIEADFAGLMSPAMPNTASEISDKIGHMICYGDGWYGGVFVGAMYAEAFVEDDIATVVNKALKTIPKESKFYKCINDVIAWHAEHPDDWKKCWQLYNDKYSKDVGCPELILAPGNIDATMNSAYVVMGLLYGEGDFEKTIDISTRCGQDSDCNPSTAGGVLATVMGYSGIPEKWMPNLREVEDITFPYTSLSLNKTYTTVYDLAIQNILAHGGSETDTTVVIATQSPKAVGLEVSFPDMSPHELTSDISYLGTEQASQNTFTFKGKGFVVHGGMEYSDGAYEAQLEVSVDGKVDRIMPLWSDYRRRTDAIYWNYDLEEGVHTVSFKLLNPKEGLNIKANRVFYYTSDIQQDISVIQPTILDAYGDECGGGVSFDFDNDGVLDLFITGLNTNAHILKGNGAQNPAEAYEEINDIGDIGKINNYACVVPCDINLDGNADLLAFDADPSGAYSNDKGEEGFFLGDGTGRFNKVDVIVMMFDGKTIDSSFDWKRIKAADIADFNLDGKPDIVISSDRIGYSNILFNCGVDDMGKMIFQRYNYDASLKIRSANKSKTLCAGYVKAYDLNSDGYMDFLLFGPTVESKAYYFINDSSNPGVFKAYEFPAYRESPSFDIADVNGDGFPEIYYAGEYHWREGWVNRIFTPVIKEDVVEYKLLCTLPWQNNDVCMGWRSSAFVDWNGDGIVDIIETGRSDTELSDASILDSRVSKIRINYGDGQNWDMPILTMGSNRNSVILSDVNNDGIIDYIRNGANDLAVNIPGLSYDEGTNVSITINPNIAVEFPKPPTLSAPCVDGNQVTFTWTPAVGAKGNETYEYAVVDSVGRIVAGSNMVCYMSGKRKIVGAGNACQAKSITLTLPNGKYTILVQAVNAGYQGSEFTNVGFEVSGPTHISSAVVGVEQNNESCYDLNGIRKGRNAHGLLITNDGCKIKR